jgi:hypothetical protein
MRVLKQAAGTGALERRTGGPRTAAGRLPVIEAG